MNACSFESAMLETPTKNVRVYWCIPSVNMHYMVRVLKLLECMVVFILLVELV